MTRWRMPMERAEALCGRLRVAWRDFVADETGAELWIDYIARQREPVAVAAVEALISTKRYAPSIADWQEACRSAAADQAPPALTATAAPPAHGLRAVIDAHLAKLAAAKASMTTEAYLAWRGHDSAKVRLGADGVIVARIGTPRPQEQR